MDERRLADGLEPREPRRPPRRKDPPTRRQDRAKAIGGKEIDLHRTVAEMLDWAMLPPAMWTTVPGGWGYLPGATAGILKACGYKKGFPDILAFFAGNTIAIELKVDRGVQSHAQREMEDKLDAAGIEYVICNSAEEVYETLKLCEFPLRRMVFQNAPKSMADKGPEASQPTQSQEGSTQG